VESAPHSAVMREAALVVTHGGHGTVIRALVNRLPMLVIPHGRDQNDNAVRVTDRGAGLSLLPDASVEDIRSAGERLLQDPSFRAAALRLGDLVAAEAEQSTLVQELEAAASGHEGRPRHHASKLSRPGHADVSSKLGSQRERVAVSSA
jgi:UDP:flavonoid glycosyltransferase YjiC (YdhE family)